jgi:hypothetical protein
MKAVDKAWLAHSPYHAVAKEVANRSARWLWEKQFLLQCTFKIQRTV